MPGPHIFHIATYQYEEPCQIVFPSPQNHVAINIFMSKHIFPYVHNGILRIRCVRKWAILAKSRPQTGPKTEALGKYFKYSLIFRFVFFLFFWTASHVNWDYQTYSKCAGAETWRAKQWTSPYDQPTKKKNMYQVHPALFFYRRKSWKFSLPRITFKNPLLSFAPSKIKRFRTIQPRRPTKNGTVCTNAPLSPMRSPHYWLGHVHRIRF